MTISDRINALPEQICGADADDGDLVSRAQVLSIVKDAIPVELDPDLHERQPVEGEEEFVWRVLDTAYNLLREAAVRVTIDSMRRAAPDAFPATDEELFALSANSGHPDAPTSYRDLAPDDGLAAAGLHAVFVQLVHRSVDDAQEGAVDAQFDRLTEGL